MSQGNDPQENNVARTSAATVAGPPILRLRFATPKGPILLAYFHVAPITLFDTSGGFLKSEARQDGDLGLPQP
jgi:hypothetical protein